MTGIPCLGRQDPTLGRRVEWDPAVDDLDPAWAQDPVGRMGPCHRAARWQALLATQGDTLAPWVAQHICRWPL